MASCRDEGRRTELAFLRRRGKVVLKRSWPSNTRVCPWRFALESTLFAVESRGFTDCHAHQLMFQCLLLRRFLEVRRLTASVGVGQSLSASEWFGRTGGNNRSGPPFARCFAGPNLLPDVLVLCEAAVVVAAHVVVLDACVCEEASVELLHPANAFCFAHLN